MSIKVEWTDIYACNWYELSEADLAAWEDQITRNLPGISGKELEEGVTRLAESWPTTKSDGTRNYPPKARDLISEIRLHRSKMAEEFESTCLFCGGSGWMLAPVTIANNRIACIGHRDIPGGYPHEQRMPCACSAGQSVATNIILKKLAGRNDLMTRERDKLHEMAREAIGWINQMPWKERLHCLSHTASLQGPERQEMREYLRKARDAAGIVSELSGAMSTPPPKAWERGFIDTTRTIGV